MKRILFYASFAFSMTGCAAVTNLAGPGIDPDFSTDWKKIDQLELEDFKKSNGQNSLFLDLNNVGTWSSGTKVVFIKPSNCTYYENNKKQFYQSCNWMAELKDIRGTQNCIQVKGYKNYDGELRYDLSEAICRWKDQINS